MKNASRLLAVCLAAVSLTSCNVFSVFEGSGSDNDKLELGEACLNDGDFTCARQEYEQIQAPVLRAEKLCLLGLTQSGLTISNLIQLIVEKNGSNKILGLLANAVAPYTESSQEGALLATAQCPAYFSLSQQRKSALLMSLSAFMGCAVRLARTNIYQTRDDVECVAIGPNDGVVDANSISKADGSVDNGNPGMCVADVDACVAGFSSFASTVLAQPGLEKIKAAYDAVPADLKDNAALLDAKRQAVRQTL